MKDFIPSPCTLLTVFHCHVCIADMMFHLKDWMMVAGVGASPIAAGTLSAESPECCFVKLFSATEGPSMIR